MDIISHGLWMGAGAKAINKKIKICLESPVIFS